MRALVALCLILMSSVGLADNHETKSLTTTIDGVTYGTGYLPREANERSNGPFFSPAFGDLPESYDSRDGGFVTPIKNQGSCGSCWIFARGASFETALIIAGHPKTIDLSEQDGLVNDRTAYGCQGGFMDGDFEVNYGLTTEDKCPYRTSDRYSCSAEKYAKATRWAMVGGANRSPTVDELRAAIYQYKTLAVTVAAGSGFSPNSEGRITSCGSTGINHMVNLIGWRPAPGGGYEFLIKNSWGTSWGLGGYGWSKQGCNRIAIAAGDAALFHYVEGTGPTPDPIVVGLPSEIGIKKGYAVALEVEKKAGVRYTWSTGTQGELAWVTPTENSTYYLFAQDAQNNVTSYSVNVVVQ